MKLAELYTKFENTGVDGVVITDSELMELKTKLEELGEFFKTHNPFKSSFKMAIISIEDILEARNRRNNHY
jgi:hypothetical protein